MTRLNGILGSAALLLALGACAQKPVTEEPKVDAKWVEQVGRDHNHEILKCYEEALKKDKKLEGDLLLSLDAGSDGRVTNVRVKDSVAPGLDACAIEKAKGWTYPWIKSETVSIQDSFHLFLKDGQPYAEFRGPGMDKDLVRGVVSSHHDQVRQCYETRLKRGRKLAGKMVLQWDILGSGDVTNVRVKQSIDPQIESCVIAQLQKWKFPSPPNNMVASITYPFTFNAKAEVE